MSTPSTPFYPMTHDDAQELIAAIGDNSKLAEAYDATRTYTVNEHCIHSGKLYRCKTAITTAEGWTAEHWEEITVGEELTENSKGLAKLIPVISGSLNNSGYTIATGDYFEANGELYKATAAIPAGQPWSAYASSVSGSALNEAVSALNSNFVNVSSVAKSSGSYQWMVEVIGFQYTASSVMVSIPFPFIASNRNYTVNVLSFNLVGTGGQDVSNVTVDSKNYGSTRLILAKSGTQGTPYSCLVEMKVTF